MKPARFCNVLGRRWGKVVKVARFSPGPFCGSERGASSVLVVGIVGVVLVLTVSTLALGSVVIASHRARSAADLGALAGATALRDGAPPSRACALTESVVAANGALLQECSVTDGSTLTVVAARKPGLWPLLATAKASAGHAPGSARAPPR